MERGKIKPIDTNRQPYALHHINISIIILGKHIATMLRHTTHIPSPTALLGPISSREELRSIKKKYIYFILFDFNFRIFVLLL